MTDSNVGEIGTLHSEIGTSEFKLETPDLIIVDGTTNNLDSDDIIEVSDSPTPDFYNSNESEIKITGIKRIKPSEGPKFVNLVTYRNKIIKMLRTIENLTLVAPIQDSYKKFLLENYKHGEGRLKRTLSYNVEQLTEIMRYDTNSRHHRRRQLRYKMMLQEQSLMRPIYSESAYTQTAPTEHFNLEENNSNIKNEYNYPEVIITEYPNIEESNSNIEMKSVPKNGN